MVSFREKLEKLETETLSQKATFSQNTRGRLSPETECKVRTAFQKDRDRILHSKAFRRLKHKTQVFISPEGDHYRTRLTHTLEVAQIARTVAKALFLNEDLTEAIALGHDLGHTPFGHAGEMVLNELVNDGGFQHNNQSLRVVDFLERPGGLNLTQEVRDGIKNHTGDITPVSLEGQIVKICDRIAYINHDIDDALRGEIISQKQLPESSGNVLGNTSNSRIDTMVCDLIETSYKNGEVSMSTRVKTAMEELREFLFQNVYVGSKAKEEESKAEYVIKAVYDYFYNEPEKLPNDVYSMIDQVGRERLVCDYVAGMTDRYILDLYRDIFLPKPWRFNREE
ncbi:deoxyguanosinetriphosphate triphosphohydrolase [Natranaerobius thermophilus]|uniref:Deoxyguanosinetriphosphate triphosphohydrolase-like protein n=1 Tax=Natranaerobius thermophilus (strain ATCC BAA-1301 / DSM 18059 / JW/NM-WN-LF) TaxID=457570 RepID=B2A1Z1_NATTJ|nr:deoxyguanosinetriphosphate triphosphohydrolase [Natranaerobius thermophilus]ACB84796.1 deoxyguanosinetriphosphate triphosphohydrolase [Natranaerobius thermophilus JW/NM-WN-LF]